MCPPIVTVTVCASLPLEVLFDGDVVAEWLLETLKVRSGRLLTVDTDGALDCHEFGSRDEDRGLAGDVDNVACRLALGGDAVCVLPNLTGRLGIIMGDRTANGPVIVGGDGIERLHDAPTAGGPLLPHIDPVSVGLVVNGFAVFHTLRRVLCLDVVLDGENAPGCDGDVLCSSVASLFVTSCPSSCFGTHNCTHAPSTIGSPLPDTTKLTMALYLSVL